MFSRVSGFITHKLFEHVARTTGVEPTIAPKLARAAEGVFARPLSTTPATSRYPTFSPTKRRSVSPSAISEWMRIRIPSATKDSGGMESSSTSPSISFSEDGGHLGMDIISQRRDQVALRIMDPSAMTSPEDKRKFYAFAFQSLSNAYLYIRSKFGKEVPLRSEAPCEHSAILFTDEPPEKIRAASDVFIKLSKSFKSTVDSIIQSNKPEAVKIEELEHFLYNGTRVEGGKTLQGIDRFNASELKNIARKFWNMGAYDQIVEMMLHSNNTFFTKNPLVLEFFAQSILKGHYFSPSHAEAIAHLLMENPESRAQGLAIIGVIEAISKNAAYNLLLEYRSGKVNDMTLSFYTLCFPNSSFEPQTVWENYQSALDRSAESYKKAFDDTTDCRYGLRMLHRLVEQSFMEKPEESESAESRLVEHEPPIVLRGLMDNQEIKRCVELTQLAALKEGGLQSNNLAVVRAYLETLYLQQPSSDPKEIELAENVLYQMCQTESQTYNVLGSLSDLVISSEKKDQFEQKMLQHLKELQETPATTQEKLKESRVRLNLLLEEWENYTYNIKGLNSNVIDGNFRFGAQLPAQNINRYDRKFFNELLATPISTLLKISDDSRTLNEIDDFDEFNRIVNTIIRENYHTDEWGLERLDSDGHKQYDETIQGLIALGGITTPESRKELPDSRTNISTNFCLGLGDCRHQTQTKQILFDLWHGKKLDDIIKKIDQAHSDGDFAEVEKLKGEFANLNSKQLHTFDCEVHLPVQIEGGVPVWHEGHMVLNESGTRVKAEEHTLNVQIDRDPQTSALQSVTLRDTFYQKTYPWEKMPIDSKRSILTEGTQAGVVKLYNRSTGKLEEHPIHIKPTRYAGTRDLHNRGSTAPRFVGQPIKRLTPEEARSQRATIERNNAAARDYYRKTT